MSTKTTNMTPIEVASQLQKLVLVTLAQACDDVNVPSMFPCSLPSLLSPSHSLSNFFFSYIILKVSIYYWKQL